MPRIAYRVRRFNEAHAAIVHAANEILDEYVAQGFVITLRQLYYQFVARNLLPNTVNSYKRLGSIVGDARLAGLIDWKYLQDRTRNLESRAHWDDPGGVIESAAQSYGRDLWAGQVRRVEVWIEKDALVGVIEPTCRKWDVTWHTSRAEVTRACRRCGWRGSACRSTGSRREPL